jgi:tetratricopeptide (TPR) repeat protein
VRALARAAGALALALAAAAGPALAADAPPAPASFEDLSVALARAEDAGDTASAERLLREIRRVRLERNVASHETLGLALVGRAFERLSAGDRAGAEERFRTAVAIAPALPDGHFGLARTLLSRGALGVVPSIGATLDGVSAFLGTARGSLNARGLLSLAWLALGFALSWAIGVALLLRRGGLLRHDIEEWLGPARARALGAAVFLAAVLLPAIAFQGWAWLPLWWLAVLFVYMGRAERVLVVALAAGTLTIGPALSSLQFRLRTAENPLYWAALSAVEGAPDAIEVARLAEVAREDAQDRDLSYLLGTALKRAGRYDEAAEVYRRVLAADPSDPVARNNLANLEFVRGAYDGALARYKAAAQAGGTPAVAATSWYNLSLAHLQKFDYQAYNEARSSAERLASGLVAGYDRWKYDTGDYAVVDLGLSRDQVWAKFAGTSSGVAVRNVFAGAPPLPQAGTLVAALWNRFAAALPVLALAAFAVARRRGEKAFTMHCGRCGTPFCRSCHLGQMTGGLCSQCYHIFVVRDGVSGPARNRKMGEVQQAEARRSRVFRVLSVIAPGAGHVYAGSTLLGVALLVVWWSTLSLYGVSRVLPVTEVPRALQPPWPTVAAGLVLLVVWALANRLQPEFVSELPARRAGARRARVAQGA